MKLKYVVALLIFLAFGLAVNAQTTGASNAAPTSNTSTATTPTTIPEYTGVIYTRGTDGSLTALPRATVKVGRMGTGIALPSDIPVLTGPLIVKLEGTADPKSLLEIGTGGKGFNKPVDFTVKPLGDRVFDLSVVAQAKGGDCVISFKAPGGAFALPTNLFAFRVAASK